MAYLIPLELAERLCNLNPDSWEALLKYLELREAQLNSQNGMIGPAETESFIALNAMQVSGGLREIRIIRDLPSTARKICEEESKRREASERKRG